MAKIKDIADATGFSLTTVSRVLNHDKAFNVSDETRIKILSTAENLNYTPPARRQKNIQKSMSLNLALVYWYSQTDELTDPYYLSIRMSIESHCQQTNINLQKYHLGTTGLLALDFSNVSGVIALGKFSEQELEHLYSLNQNIILVDCYTPHYNIDVVTSDLKGATKQILQHLHDKNITQIGFMCGVEKTLDGQELIDVRLLTYRKHMQQNKLFNPNHVYLGEFSADSAYELMSDIITKDQLLDAYIVASDSMAIGCLKALNEHKVSVPDKVSIISYDNISLSQYTIPSLSTVDMNTAFMGKTAVETLVERLESNRLISKKIMIPTKLIQRGSSV